MSVEDSVSYSLNIAVHTRAFQQSLGRVFRSLENQWCDQVRSIEVTSSGILRYNSCLGLVPNWGHVWGDQSSWEKASNMQLALQDALGEEHL